MYRSEVWAERPVFTFGRRYERNLKPDHPHSLAQAGVEPVADITLRKASDRNKSTPFIKPVKRGKLFLCLRK